MRPDDSQSDEMADVEEVRRRPKAERATEAARRVMIRAPEGCESPEGRSCESPEGCER